MCASPCSSSVCDQRRLTRNATTAARTEPAICRRRRAPPAATPGPSRDGWRRQSDRQREDRGSARKGAYRTAESWTAFLASSLEAFPGRMPADACPPLQGTTWRRPIVGEVVTGWVGESATVHHSPYTCSRIAGTHAVRTRQTSHSIALRDVENPATLRVRCGSSSPLLRSRPSDRSSVYGGTGAR